MRRACLMFVAATALAAPQVPLRFEPHGAGFAARWDRLAIQLTPQGIDVTDGRHHAAIRFEHANPGVIIEGLDALASRSHYISGSNPRNWRLNLENFARVRYRNLYPGIDAVFYTSAAGRLEYDFIVSPGADPASIRLLASAAPRARAQDLIIGRMVLKEPRVYQGDQQVPASYRVSGRRIGFELAAYDRSRWLVIDPELDYSSYLGGTGGSVGESVAVDGEGNIYVTGTTTSNGFPTSNAMQPLFFGSNEVFVAKFDPSGSQLLYSTYLGSWGDDKATDIAVDSTGAAYITGFTTSPDFPTTRDAYQISYAGGSPANGGDAFLVKISPDGSGLVFSTLFGGSGDEISRTLAVDAAGNVVIGGSTTSLDLPLETPLRAALEGVRDPFLAKFDSTGSRLLWSTYLGGPANDEGFGVALDREANVFFTGFTASFEGFPTTPETFQPFYTGGTRDVFVMKIRADGQELMYSTLLGGTAEDTGKSIVVDSQGNAYVTGYTTSGNFRRARPFQSAYGTNRDAFLAKLNPDASELMYSTYLGGSASDEGFGIGVTANGEAVLAGFTQSKNFPLRNPIQPAIAVVCAANSCTADVWVAKFTAAGDRLEYSTYLGGTAADQSRAVAIGPDGTAVVTGYTASTNFPLARPFQAVQGGGGTNIAFVLRLTDFQPDQQTPQ